MSDEATNFSEAARKYRQKTGTVIADGYFEQYLRPMTEVVVVQYDDGTVIIWLAEDLQDA